ncbi:MAG: response regulator transcription factor, partial [Kiritimatiellae bacterium]|nr:response regulator transcription factor [Kiritimatiellia bacterium]
MNKTHILIADDHMLMRMGISALVTSTNDMEFVGEAKNGRQAVELADSLKPNVIIMDLMM